MNSMDRRFLGLCIIFIFCNSEVYKSCDQGSRYNADMKWIGMDCCVGEERLYLQNIAGDLYSNVLDTCVPWDPGVY